jgi:hypothetical protein
MVLRVSSDPVVKHERIALIGAQAAHEPELHLAGWGLDDPSVDPEVKPKRPSRFDNRVNPRWLRIPAAVQYSGINRSRLFKLIAEGAIKSACLKEHRGAKRGLRLVDRFSLDLYLEILSKPVEERLVAESNELMAQEAELARVQKALTQKQQSVAKALAKIRRLEPPEQ